MSVGDYTDKIDKNIDFRNLKESFENINKKYILSVEGEKKACKYGIEAFVEWLNNYYLLDNGKAYIINKNAKRWDTDNIRLIF